MSLKQCLKGGVCYGDFDNKSPAETLEGSYPSSFIAEIVEPLGLGSFSWKIGLGCPDFLWLRVNEVLSHESLAPNWEKKCECWFFKWKIGMKPLAPDHSEVICLNRISSVGPCVTCMHIQIDR